MPLSGHAQADGRIAYHEAGHVAAHAFFYHDWSKIRHVTILPNKEFLGHVRRCPVIPKVHYLGTLPSEMRVGVAYVEAICTLAGPVAEAKYLRAKFDFHETAEQLALSADGFMIAESDG